MGVLGLTGSQKKAGSCPNKMLALYRELREYMCVAHKKRQTLHILSGVKKDISGTIVAYSRTSFVLR
jgi:hypothetical protein